MFNDYSYFKIYTYYKFIFYLNFFFLFNRKNNHLIDKILIVGDKNQNIFEPIYSFRNSHLDIKTLQVCQHIYFKFFLYKHVSLKV